MVDYQKGPINFALLAGTQTPTWSLSRHPTATRVTRPLQYPSTLPLLQVRNATVALLDYGESVDIFMVYLLTQVLEQCYLSSSSAHSFRMFASIVLPTATSPVMRPCTIELWYPMRTVVISTEVFSKASPNVTGSCLTDAYRPGLYPELCSLIGQCRVLVVIFWCHRSRTCLLKSVSRYSLLRIKFFGFLRGQLHFTHSLC